MAKYKVGDKVKVGGHTATIVKILGTSASGEQMYGVKQDDNGWAYESLDGKMKAAANAKFKVGQKVARVSDGKVGVIQEAYADGTYAVHVDGEANPNKMPENRIRAVNSSIKSTNPIVSNAIKACNEYHEYIPKGWKRDSNYGNFKKGDYVLLDRKIYKIVDDFKYSDEVPVQPLHGGKTEIRDLLHAVGIVKNSYVATNASPVKPGERCKWRNGPFEWKGVLVSGKPGNYIVNDDDGRQHVWHGNVYHLDEKYQTISTPFGTFYNGKIAKNSETTPDSILKLEGKSGDLYIKVIKTLQEYVNSLTSLNAECVRLKDKEFLRKDELKVAKESLANIMSVNY